MIRFDVLTLFPGIFESYVGQSLLDDAIRAGLVQVHAWNIRDWTAGQAPEGGRPAVRRRPRHGADGPAGGRLRRGGAGEGRAAGQLVMLTPAGERLTQRTVEKLAREPRLLLLCGRYEGFDDRIRQVLKPWEISVGDFVCNGGEVPAMVVIDAVIRLIPGVLGDEAERGRRIAQRDGPARIPAVHPAAGVSRAGGAGSPPERQPRGHREVAARTKSEKPNTSTASSKGGP